MEDLAALGMSLLAQGPTYVATLAGMVLALARWNRHRRTSLLALVGLGGSMATSIASTAVSTLLPIYLSKRGVPLSQMRYFFGAFTLVSSTLHAGWLAFVIAAIFAERKIYPSSPPVAESEGVGR